MRGDFRLIGGEGRSQPPSGVDGLQMDISQHGQVGMIANTPDDATPVEPSKDCRSIFKRRPKPVHARDFMCQRPEATNFVLGIIAAARGTINLQQ